MMYQIIITKNTMPNQVEWEGPKPEKIRIWIKDIKPNLNLR